MSSPYQAELNYIEDINSIERYFHANYQQSVLVITDEHGGQTNELAYEPFGDIAYSNGNDNFYPKYSGKELDEASNLYYFGARYYNAETGQFISPDPASQYSNPYIYGDGDPLSGTDPDGQFFFITALIVGAIIGAYVGGAVANHSANPAHWDWKSGKTYAGIFLGAAVGVGIVATGGAAAAGLGVVSAEAVTVGGMAAGSIAMTSMDVAFLTYDAYQFSQDQSVENGIFLALDLIPFVGPLVGRAFKGARAAIRGAEALEHGVEMETRGVESLEHLNEASCALSFKENTLVDTEEGLKPIQDIDVGDRVRSYNQRTGEIQFKPVKRLFKYVAATVIGLVIQGDTLTATANHPFMLKDKGWVEAEFITQGDTVVYNQASPDADYHFGYTVVDGVHHLSKAEVVYNLEVDVNHTYFVSSWGYLVHNPPCNVTRSGKYFNWSPFAWRYEEEFTTTLDRTNLQHGTPTTTGTREYVNGAADIPSSYQMHYTTTSPTGVSSHYSTTVIDNSPIPGRRWHAGHGASRASGGEGHVFNNIFPQRADVNMGHNGTYDLWRRHEAFIVQKMSEGYTINWKLVLHY
jgi:RHS repeat-associated protein